MRLLFVLHDIDWYCYSCFGQPYKRIFITYLNIWRTQVPTRFLIHILNQDLKIPRDVASPALAHKRKAARDPSTGCCWCLSCVVESTSDMFLIAFFWDLFKCAFVFFVPVCLLLSNQIAVEHQNCKSFRCTTWRLRLVPAHPTKKPRRAGFWRPQRQLRAYLGPSLRR